MKAYEFSAIEKFSENLKGLGFPLPLAFAFVGTWMVLIGYVLVVIGWKTKWAAIPVVIYFGVAVFVYHVPEGHGLSKMMAALAPMMMGLFFMLHGAGKPSVDEGV